MEKIGFLTWYRFDDIASTTTRNKLKIFYKYVIKNIEEDIKSGTTKIYPSITSFIIIGLLINVML